MIAITIWSAITFSGISRSWSGSDRRSFFSQMIRNWSPILKKVIGHFFVISLFLFRYFVKFHEFKKIKNKQSYPWFDVGESKLELAEPRLDPRDTINLGGRSKTVLLILEWYIFLSLFDISLLTSILSCVSYWGNYLIVLTNNWILFLYLKKNMYRY